MSSVNLLDEDLSLWNGFRKGDAQAFGKLMRAHYSDLYHYGMRFTRNEELLKQCIQDLFLALWTQRLTVSDVCFLKYYLLKRLRSSLTLSFGEGNPASWYELRGKEHLSDLARRMRKVLAGLTRRQQEVIYLHFQLEADCEEIADIMSLNLQTVEQLLEDTLRKLRKVTPTKTIYGQR